MASLRLQPECCYCCERGAWQDAWQHEDSDVGRRRRLVVVEAGGEKRDDDAHSEEEEEEEEDD